MLQTKASESVQRIASSSTQLRKNAGKLTLHCVLCRKQDHQCADKGYEHFTENYQVKLVWDMKILTDRRYINGHGITLVYINRINCRCGALVYVLRDGGACENIGTKTWQHYFSKWCIQCYPHESICHAKHHGNT